jgi:hypothetical protein
MTPSLARGSHLLKNQLVLKTPGTSLLLEIGTRRPEQDEVLYPGIDLRMPAGRAGFAHADGTPYER